MVAAAEEQAEEAGVGVVTGWRLKRRVRWMSWLKRRRLRRWRHRCMEGACDGGGEVELKWGAFPEHRRVLCNNINMKTSSIVV